MEKNIKTTEEENARMREALRKIAAHNAEITRLLESVQDILKQEEVEEHAPVTDEAVKNLLKKYSRL